MHSDFSDIKMSEGRSSKLMGKHSEANTPMFFPPLSTPSALASMSCSCVCSMTVDATSCLTCTVQEEGECNQPGLYQRSHRTSWRYLSLLSLSFYAYVYNILCIWIDVCIYIYVRVHTHTHTFHAYTYMWNVWHKYLRVFIYVNTCKCIYIYTESKRENEIYTVVWHGWARLTPAGLASKLEAHREELNLSVHRQNVFFRKSPLWALRSSTDWTRPACIVEDNLLCLKSIAYEL